MGYYSEVALCFSKQGHEDFIAELEKQDEATKQDFAEMKDSATIKEVDGSTLYYWDHLKWYEDFLGIKFIEKWMKEVFYELPKNTRENNYLFIRVGEHILDNIYSGDYWGNPFSISLERNISYV